MFITKVNFTIPKLVATVTSYGELATLTSPSIFDIYEKVIQIRQQKLPDPKQIGNAGSFFKNQLSLHNILRHCRLDFRRSLLSLFQTT